MPGPDYFAEKRSAGWALVSLEWEREVSSDTVAPARLHEVPYGFRIAADCCHLEESEEESRALTVMLDSIVHDRPLSQVAAELNRRGFRTRRKMPWNPVDIFNMLPRLVERGPAIFSSPEWAALKQHA
ncbi:MAG TPA: hypothetical protein VF767_05005 [Bryobacteraceae bacterium]